MERRFQERLWNLFIFRTFQLFSGLRDDYNYPMQCLIDQQNKDRYEGEFDHDFMHGNGVFVYANGDMAQGRWEKDQRFV
jgi:hypothetical protein